MAVARPAGHPSAAEGKEKHGDYFYDLFAVLYHLTGEDKYKDAVMKATDDGRRMLRAAIGEHEYFPPAAHWLLTQPPKAKAGSSSKPR